MPAIEGGGAPSPCEMLFWLPAPRALLAIGNGRMHLVSAYSGEVSAPDIDLLPGLCTAAISDDGERLAVGTSKGLLVVYDPLVHEGEVAFISHQWTAWNAADPGFDQLGVLKRFIERILEGDIKKGTGNPCFFPSRFRGSLGFLPDAH